METKLYNQNGDEIGSVELKPDLFEVEPNEAVVHQYVTVYLARQRQGTASSKGRTEVTGGGRKPWRQKGTGRARSGTIRSPLWRGGGIVFGPHPRTYDLAIPRRMKRTAIKSIFSDKAARSGIRVIDRLELPQTKTKQVVEILSRLQLTGKKCLILDEGPNESMVLSCRNLPRVQYRRAALANGYELLHADVVLFTKAGLDKAHEVFA